ncbi:MAG TPA: hypothetical protein VJJ55_02875, partial [Candidatus Paceibacterota bacterium]
MQYEVCKRQRRKQCLGGSLRADRTSGERSDLSPPPETCYTLLTAHHKYPSGVVGVEDSAALHEKPNCLIERLSHPNHRSGVLGPAL